MKKIAISGTSGVGKTTLAKYISEKYNIPFVTMSTKPLWDKLGITSHEDILKRSAEDKHWALQFQDLILDERERLDKENNTYVTDRGPIDNIVYFLLQCSQYVTELNTHSYIQRCLELQKNITHQIILPFTEEVVLEQDNKRISNPYYQMTVDSVFSQVYRRYIGKNNKTLLILEWDWEKRKKIAGDFISPIELNHTEIRI